MSIHVSCTKFCAPLFSLPLLLLLVNIALVDIQKISVAEQYCQVAGTIFLQELAKLIRIFLLNPYNMYDDSYIYILIV